MVSTSWLRWLQRAIPSSRAGRNRRHRPAGRLRPIVPVLISLEDRSLPSTFTVSTLADSGSGSLRQAILDADSNGGANAIVFADGLHGTIALTSDELTITNDLTVTGPGFARLAVSGDDAHRVFEVTSGVHVTMTDLAITHGAADVGGGILNDGGDLTLSGVVLSHNQALGSDGDLGRPRWRYPQH